MSRPVASCASMARSLSDADSYCRRNLSRAARSSTDESRASTTLSEPLVTTPETQDGRAAARPRRRQSTADRNTKRLQLATKLRVRKAAARDVLMRSLALLVVGMVGLLLQCVALDLAVMDDPDSDEHVLYDFDTSVRFFFPQLALTVVGWVVLANYYAVSWHHYLTFQLLPRNPDRFRHATRRNPPPYSRRPCF